MKTKSHKLLVVLTSLLILSLTLGFAAAFQPAGTARGQAADVQIKPVVAYPEAYAESLPISEISSDLIKNGERKPISGPSPNLPGPNSLDSTQESSDLPAEEIFEFPMMPLPKGESGGSLPTAPNGRQPARLSNNTVDAALQTNLVETLSIPSPDLSFDGLSFQDNLNAGFGLLSPPDTNGDVGPNHYVQMTNLLVRVWDKAGNPLTAPFKLSSLFTPLGGQCAAPDAGDPIVLYDPLADRWLLSQFAFASTSSPPYHECIAISQTGDPTGAYHLYDFVTPGNEFPDYPKLGVWPDAYYMTTNQFLLGGSFDGAGVFAFDRDKMLVGDPSASLIYFNLNLASHPEGIGGMLPSDFDGMTPPPTGRPNTFAYFLATEFGDALDGLRLFDFHADFANPLNSTFTERSESPVPVAAFNPLSPAGRNDILQPPPATTSNGLDSISDRLMHRLQYRNFGTYESLVTNHTVNVSGGTTISTYRAGVRYYQLTSSGSAFSVAEQGTYAPDDGASRWMGSAAVDGLGNLAVGYSVSSSTTFPSIRYAGRLPIDPPGTLSTEQSIIEGTGVQRSTGGRWGDYSALAVDPVDDCTFWYTTEYYTAASQAASTVGWLTRIGSFRVAPNCTTAPSGVLQGTVTNAQDNSPINGALIEIQGGISASTDAAGFYTRTLVSGTYNVTASKFGYLPANASVTVTDGGITVQDFSLTPLPVINSDGSTLVAESFQPGNNALDPAETVTVDFTLVNVGPGSSSNLVGTLLNSGGVLDSSGSATYGSIPASGGTGAQSFTFRVDPSLACGSDLIATMQLQDGAYDLGTVSFTLTVGVQIIALSENFDGVSAPALPGGWTATVASGLSTNNWSTVTTTPDTAPNAAFVPDPSSVHDIRLDTPVFTVPNAGSQLTFRNNYATEAGFDGGVLEISINGGAFVDILAAGGSFVSGGYNRTLSTGFSNPLPGRQAWSGSSGGYISTVVNLPASAAGQNVQLRFRMGSDSSVSSTGWRVDSVLVSGGFACAINIQANGAQITSESFLPLNAQVDPGEKLRVDFNLKNVGSSATSNLVATLLNTGGVLNSSGSENYGVLSGGGGTGTQNYGFVADPNLVCGSSLTATLQLQDGTTDLGTVSYVLKTGTSLIPFSENFDGVSAPVLPGGWTATVASGLSTNNWRTVTTTVDSAPNAAFVPDPSTVHDIRLDTPVFGVSSPSAQLTFRNNYATEAGFDGGVLEISINGGAFVDILAAGGSFVSGGYNRTLSTSFSNPLPGRQAWSGSSGGYISTVVNLPASAAGQNVQLRFRMGSDSSVSSTGWRVDTIEVFDGYSCATNAAPVVTAAPASQMVQYSDPITPVSITATDAALDTPLAVSTQWQFNGGAFTAGLPGWLTLADDGCTSSGSSGTCAWTLSGTVLAAPGTYLVRVAASDDLGASGSTDITIQVTQEDARAFYSGVLFASTSSTSSSTADVLLAATIQDISVTPDAGGDNYPGDIRNANVSFVDRGNGNAVLCTSNVGLINPSDLQSGTASCTATVNLGNADSTSLQVGIIVGGYYTRNSSTDDTLVTISKPYGTEFITGGGYLTLTNSAGIKAGDAGSKNNFGFDVKYNRNGRNLRGHVNIIVRRTEANGVLRVYQVKGNVMSSLTVNASTGRAVFTGRASIQDVTDPNNPISVDGNATLQLTLSDFGEPGSSDTIGITVWNKNGGMWFSSNWDNAKTVEQLLGGGNLIVH